MINFLEICMKITNMIYWSVFLAVSSQTIVIIILNMLLLIGKLFFTIKKDYLLTYLWALMTL